MITIYTLPNCTYCEKTKEHLKELNVPYNEVNLKAKENRDAREYYRSLGIKTAPVVTGMSKNGQWIVYGLDLKALDKFIKE